MRTDPIRLRRQRGTASMEMALIAPVLLLFVILAENSARIMLIKQHAVVRARTAAWREATQGFCLPIPMDVFDGKLIPACLGTDRSDGEDLLAKMDGWGTSETRGSSKDVRDADDQPELTSGQALALYKPFGVRGVGFLGYLDIRAEHHVSTNRAWEREDLPVGYDPFLEGKYGRDYIFPNVFPRAQGGTGYAPVPGQNAGSNAGSSSTFDKLAGMAKRVDKVLSWF
jgi:hypothetical protein